MFLNSLLLTAGITLSVIIVAGAVFLAYRYAAPRHTPAIKSNYSITELIAVPINGVNQWLLIRGVDKQNPVLLFLHGGPGSAHIGILRNYQKELEKHFVVVQWDQRGAGLSTQQAIDEATYNKEQFVSDGLEVTRYLRERFNKERLYLVGHSWGSSLGYILAVRYPENYYAFAGLGQMSRDGEGLAYAETLKVAREANHTEAIKELMELGAPPYTKVPTTKGTLHKAEPGHEALAGMLVRFKWSEALGGDAKYIKISHLIIKELLLSSEYTLKDAFSWLTHKSRSINHMYEECNQNIDLYKEGTQFNIPVFFLLGCWDLLTVPDGAVALMEAIHAPKKQIYWFDAGHEIHWERPEEYQRVLIEAFNV
jgi:pimeloyl-ACP methyl ester carboxylesterase